MSENAPDQNTQDTTPTFAELGIDARVLAALETIGYEKPSPIQEATIPVLLEGRDVVGMAQTGTGKTAAFAVPALSRLAELADLHGPSHSTQVLVLAPTRELALQVGEAFASYAVQLEDFTVLPVYGGSSYGPQLAGLRRGAQVVVGTPGRVIDHLKRGSLKLDDLQYLVLDEADEMLRMGFAEDVETILSQTPEDKQVALFSATMPPAIRKIAQRYLRNPEEISVKAKTSTATNIRQRYLQVMGAHKLEANDKNANALAASTAKSGSPLLVQYANTLGACPRSASPYSTRDEQKRNEFPAENAEVKTPALMMCGRTLMLARVMAIT